MQASHRGADICIHFIHGTHTQWGLSKCVFRLKVIIIKKGTLEALGAFKKKNICRLASKDDKNGCKETVCQYGKEQQLLIIR